MAVVFSVVEQKVLLNFGLPLLKRARLSAVLEQV
jgi:hypothetical protein